MPPEIIAPAYFLPGGPVGILFIHGFTASPTELWPLAQKLHAAGYTVSGVRLAGHGTHLDDLRTTSWQDWLDSARQDLEEIHQHCDEVCITGLSMGGLLAVQLAARWPQQVQRLCLLAPSFRVQSPFLFLAPALKYLLRSIPKAQHSLDYFQQHQLFAYGAMPVSALAELEHLIRATSPLLSAIRQPTCIFMGMRDHTVVPASGQNLYAALPAQSKKLVHLPNSGHILSVEADAEYMLSSMLSFLEEQLQKKERGL